MLFQFELVRPSVLVSIAQPMQRTDARVPAPRKDQLGNASHSNQLIVNQICCHPDKREILVALPDHLVTRRMRYEMREALQSDSVAVMNGGFNRFRERGNSRHTE